MLFDYVVSWVLPYFDEVIEDDFFLGGFKKHLKRAPKKRCAFALLYPELETFIPIKSFSLNLISKLLPEIHCHRFHLILPDPCLRPLQKAFFFVIVRENSNWRKRSVVDAHPQPFYIIHSRRSSAAKSKWSFLRNCKNAVGPKAIFEQVVPFRKISNSLTLMYERLNQWILSRLYWVWFNFSLRLEAGFISWLCWAANYLLATVWKL